MAVFETERLVARPWTRSDGDIDRLFDIYSRHEVARWLGSISKPLRERQEVYEVVDRYVCA